MTKEGHINTKETEGKKMSSKKVNLDTLHKYQNKLQFSEHNMLTKNIKYLEKHYSEYLICGLLKTL